MTPEDLTASNHELSPNLGLLEQILNEKLAKGQFTIQEGETEQMVRERAEFIRAVLPEIPALAKKIIEEARMLLSKKEATKEDTGKLSIYLVGGRVRKDSNLKTWSDYDLVVASSRKSTLPRTEEIRIAKELTTILHTKLLLEISARLSEKIGRPVDISNASTGLEQGLIGIDGFCEQRPEEMTDPEQYFLLAKE